MYGMKEVCHSQLCWSGRFVLRCWHEHYSP